jgi:hypothetical protein
MVQCKRYLLDPCKRVLTASRVLVLRSYKRGPCSNFETQVQVLDLHA